MGADAHGLGEQGKPAGPSWYSTIAVLPFVF